MSRASVYACAAALSMLAGPLRAQSPWEVSFGATGAAEIARSRVGTTRERLSGLVFTGEADVTRSRFVGRLRYGQGRITNDTAARDVAEGDAAVGFKARPWLTVWAGPNIRTYSVPDLSDRRWLFWSARATARGSLFPGRLESFVEVWQGLTGRLNRPAETASGRGGEAGLTVRLPRRPLWARLTYRIEQGRAGGGRRETVEALTLTVGYVPLR
jgi:hypothetical protein